MNDITALAQRMSIERILEIAKGGTPIIGEKERLAITALYFHQELQICTKAFQAAGLAQLAAEEALEKAQQTEKTIKSRNRRLEGIISVAENRIAEFESRTVTVKLPLPRRKIADDYVDDTFEPCDLAAIYNACRLECEVKFKNALVAAGIQVIEGEE